MAKLGNLEEFIQTMTQCTCIVVTIPLKPVYSAEVLVHHINFNMAMYTIQCRAHKMRLCD